MGAPLADSPSSDMGLKYAIKAPKGEIAPIGRPLKKKNPRDVFITWVLGPKGQIWWRIRDLNPGPADYDSVALTS